ncbi:MAG: hypothetical protein ACI8T1_001572 [Verrucomicrobiales bacterium]|jgi:hypothetical protein
MAASMTAVSHGASLLGGVDDAALADGSVDGWSGTTAISVPLSGGDTIQVTDFSFFAADGRADGTRHVTPLILARPIGSAFDAAATVIGIGTEVQVTTPGANNFPFSVTMGTDTLSLTGADEFLAGFWQRADGVDDVEGGVVAFADAGGPGMFQRNEDGLTHVPGLGGLVDAGHAAAADGRNYQFNLEGNVVPEPSVFLLIGLSGLAMIFRRRRQ